jgi:hypothetical protein
MKPNTWKRPELAVRAPQRAMAGLYRAAERVQHGTTLGGVPVQTVNDAVTATVQLGYKVADRQIERARRLAQRLGSVPAPGGGSGAEAWLDQAEQLLGKAVMAGAGATEAAFTGADSPLRRLARAELQLLSQWLGMPPAAAAPAAPAAPVPALAIRLDCADPRDRRGVTLLRAQWQALPAEALDLWFHHGGSDGLINGTLQRVDGQDRLSLRTLRTHAAGTWRAAVCGSDGLQLGTLDIEL